MTATHEPNSDAPLNPDEDDAHTKRKDRLSFANDVVWSLGFDGLTVVANIVAFLLLIPIFGDEGYGAYIGLFGIIGPLGGLAWAGVGLAALQRIVRDEKDPAAVTRAMLGQGLALASAGSILAVLVALATVRTLSLLEIGSIVFAELMALTVVMISSFVLQGVKGVPAASRLRITVVLIRIIVVVSLSVSGQLTIANIGIATSVLFSLLTIWVLTRTLPAAGLRVLPGSFSKDDRNMALSFSVPMVGSNLQLDGDKTVLNAYGMEDVAGVYGAAFRVINMAFTPIRALQSAMHNRLLPHDADDHGLHVRRAKSFAWLNMATILPIGVILFFGVELFEPLLGEDFAESSRMARWLLIFMPIKALSGVPIGALLGLGRTTTRAWVMGISAVVSLALYIALIPSLSWVGAVIGTVVGELVLLVLGTERLLTWQRRSDEGTLETYSA